MPNIETDSSDVLAHVDDGVAVVTLNRPQRRNALHRSMMEALGTLLGQLELDSNVGAVVLTGAGRSFSAGGDVKLMAAEGDAGSQTRPLPPALVIHDQRLRQRATIERLWNMPKPTIAALPGAAAGAGLSLALACDMRYATPGAILTTAFAKVGLSGDYGGAWLLTRLVGTAKARELFYLSERVSADEALRLGILNAVFKDDHLMSGVLALARQIACGPRIAFRYMKENLNHAVDWRLADAMDAEVSYHVHTSGTDDHREAAAAFVANREPRFVGR
jgi:2-(1,2-epoxy-1,2-dihydrophenyl)acetyl-CoA isomerase